MPGIFAKAVAAVLFALLAFAPEVASGGETLEVRLSRESGPAEALVEVEASPCTEAEWLRWLDSHSLEFREPAVELEYEVEGGVLRGEYTIAPDDDPGDGFFSVRCDETTDTARFMVTGSETGTATAGEEDRRPVRTLGSSRRWSRPRLCRGPR